MVLEQGAPGSFSCWKSVMPDLFYSRQLFHTRGHLWLLYNMHSLKTTKPYIFCDVLASSTQKVDICSRLYFHMLTGLASQKFQWEPTQNMPAPCRQMLLLARIKMNTLREVPHNQEKEHFPKDCQTSGKLLQEICWGTEWRTLCTLLICHLQLWGSELMPEESVVFPITKPHTGYCL